MLRVFETKRVGVFVDVRREHEVEGFDLLAPSLPPVHANEGLEQRGA